MGIDLNRLASQGRAYSVAREWTPEEWEAVVLLERECHLSRGAAADFVRNGITTLDAYNAATDAGFTPKTLDDVKVDVDAALKDNKFAVDPEQAAKDAAKAKAKADKEAAKAAKDAAKGKKK